MATKAILFITVQAILVQIISGQYCTGYNGIVADGLPWGPATNAITWEANPWDGYQYEAPLATWAAAPSTSTPYATVEWATGFGPASLTASHGASFPITSASPYAITGVSMASENVYEGPLAVAGAMPFLGGVALEGLLPTVGAGAVNYACGNGNVAIVSEDMAAAYPSYSGAYGYGPGFSVELGYGYGAPLGYEAELAEPAYGYNRGCGAMY